MKIIAAGNIFTGTFERDGMGGILTLGRNFECRPNKLKDITNIHLQKSL